MCVLEEDDQMSEKESELLIIDMFRSLFANVTI